MLYIITDLSLYTKYNKNISKSELLTCALGALNQMWWRDNPSSHLVSPPWFKPFSKEKHIVMLTLTTVQSLFLEWKLDNSALFKLYLLKCLWYILLQNISKKPQLFGWKWFTMDFFFIPILIICMKQRLFIELSNSFGKHILIKLLNSFKCENWWVGHVSPMVTLPSLHYFNKKHIYLKLCKVVFVQIIKTQWNFFARRTRTHHKILNLIRAVLIQRQSWQKICLFYLSFTKLLFPPDSVVIDIYSVFQTHHNHLNIIHLL